MQALLWFATDSDNPLQAVLSVLVRNYAFELRDGTDTEFVMGRGVLPRPKVAGEEGCCLPLLVRRVE